MLIIKIFSEVNAASFYLIYEVDCSHARLSLVGVNSSHGIVAGATPMINLEQTENILVWF